MLCPKCKYVDSKVIDSRPVNDSGSIRRRRECLNCKYRFTTYENIENKPLIVIKKSGSSEEFDPDKLFRGILTSCAKRPIDSSVIEQLIDEVELDLRQNNIREIQSRDIGALVLEKLARIDDVAYIRFASVYNDFSNIEQFKDFLNNIVSL